jgi:uncharacterized protein (UPF0276 family)
MSEAANNPCPIPAKAGIGLRFQHHQVVLDVRPDVAWMEVHTENYMGGGTPLQYLDAIRRDVPISLHGVGLSLGSADGLDQAHLDRVRQVAERIEPGLLASAVALTPAFAADPGPTPRRHRQFLKARLPEQGILEFAGELFGPTPARQEAHQGA